MRRALTFIFSFLIAIGITIYSKSRNPNRNSSTRVASTWKTFSKNNLNEVVGYQTTKDEYSAAKIPAPLDIPSGIARQPSSLPPVTFLTRNNRKLMGNVDAKYADNDTELEMLNVVGPDWKEQMGSDLMRFQSANTKIMVREDAPMIKIENGKGRFVEQVTITFLLASGSTNSFKALVDSESGRILETWDKTIHERLKEHREVFVLPDVNESGIITR